MPPELTALPPQPTTTIDQQRQAIFNSELKNLMGQSMTAQDRGDEEAANRAVRDMNSLLMEAQRNRIPLSY
jgi:ribosomal protein S20